MAPDGMAHHRVAPDGIAPDRLAPDGIAPDRLAPDGTAPDGVAPDGAAPERGDPVSPARSGLRFRLTLLSTALFALVVALMLALAYVVVGRVVAALPQFPPGTSVVIDGVVEDAGVFSASVAARGRETVLIVGFIAFPLLAGAAAWVGWVLIGRTLRPLSTLTSAARELSESSLDQRISLSGPRDEVAELADVFDEMLDRLQAAFAAERRFVANASHELRTPLSVIRTEIDVTLADPGVTVVELRQMGEVVREATDRAEKLLSSLLLLARTQASGVAVWRRIDLAELVTPALSAVGSELLARQLRVEVEAVPAPVRADPVLIERVVGNLVENAVRHNVSGGVIDIRTGRAGASRSFLEVCSGGPEIDADTVAQLFEPFRQGDRARTGHRGSGLGLSIVRAVVAAHHGTVTAESVAGGGLTVRVELPTD